MSALRNSGLSQTPGYHKQAPVDTLALFMCAPIGHLSLDKHSCHLSTELGGGSAGPLVTVTKQLCHNVTRTFNNYHPRNQYLQMYRIYTMLSLTFFQILLATPRYGHYHSHVSYGKTGIP